MRHKKISGSGTLKQFSRAAWVLLQRGGKIYKNVFEEKYWPLPKPKEGLGIVIEVELKIEERKQILLKGYKALLEIFMKILIKLAGM